MKFVPGIAQNCNFYALAAFKPQESWACLNFLPSQKLGMKFLPTASQPRKYGAYSNPLSKFLTTLGKISYQQRLSNSSKQLDIRAQVRNLHPLGMKFHPEIAKKPQYLAISPGQKH